MGNRRDPKHPLLDHLGEQERVPPDRLPDVSAWERIYSVGPMLIAKASEFLKTLPARERAQFDIEDVVMHLMTELHEKDDLWDHTRGAYTTFAGTLVRNCCIEMRRQTHMVVSPRRPDMLLEAYEERRTRRALTADLRQSERCVNIAAAPMEALANADTLQWDSDLVAEFEAEEELSAFRGLVGKLMKRLEDQQQVAVIGMTYGIGPWTKTEGAEIARRLGVTDSMVGALRTKAMSQLRVLMADWRDRP